MDGRRLLPVKRPKKQYQRNPGQRRKHHTDRLPGIKWHVYTFTLLHNNI